MAGVRAGGPHVGPDLPYKPVNERFTRDGSIVSVSLVNFMVYSSITVWPGSRMNLVLGPNGSGKSSVVCAIVLGLGGTPKMLGRADKLRGFVRRGQKEGLIKITLYRRDGDDYIIERRITSDSDKSTWQLNRKPASADRIKSLVRDLGINVDNLCNVLPQEQMGKFTTYNSKQLLAETQKALDVTLYNTQAGLISEQEEAMKTDGTLQSKRKRVQQLQTVVDSLQAVAERIAERNAMIDKKGVLNVVLADAKQKHCHAEATRLQELKKAKSQELKTAKKALDPLRKLFDQAKADSEQVEATRRKLDKKRTQAVQAAERARIQATQARQAVTTLQDKLYGLDDETERIDKQIETARERLVQAETEQANVATLATLKQQRDEARAVVQEHSVAQSQFSNKRRQLEHEHTQRQREAQAANRKVQQLQNTGNARRKIAATTVRGRDALAALRKVEELRQQRKFRGEVHGPVAMELNLKALAGSSLKQNAEILERAIPTWFLWAFIFSDRGDERTLRTALGRELGSKVSYVTVEASTRQQVYDTSFLAPDGVIGTAADLFDAPPRVREAVLQQAHLGETLVGNEKLEETARTSDWMAKKPVINGRLVQVLMTPNTEFRAKRGRDGKVSFSVSHVNRQFVSGVLTASVDKSALAAAEDGLRAAREQIQLVAEQLQHLQREYAPVAKALQQANASVDAIKREVAKRKNVDRKVVRARETLADLKGQKEQLAAKLEATRAKLTRKLAVQCLGAAKLAVEATTLYNKAAHTTLAFQLPAARLYQLAHRQNVIKGFYQQESRALAHLKQERDEAKRAFDAAKAQLKRLIAAAAELPALDVVHPRYGKTYQALRMEWKLTDDVEELEASIQDLEARISVIRDDDNDVARYESAKESLAVAIADRDEFERQASTTMTRFQSHKDKWEVELRGHLDRIAVTFTEYFSAIGCRGEMHVDIPELVADAAIVLKVAFREGEPLKVLSAKTQSGGERAVSTMLFLLAMQKNPTSKKSPFRLVDEMNQGMDHNNERAVFQLIVDACARDVQSPQYIVLTPKLLSNLQYQPHCRVHIVFNGPYVDVGDRSEDLITACIARKRQLLHDAGNDGGDEGDEGRTSKHSNGRTHKKQRTRR